MIQKNPNMNEGFQRTTKEPDVFKYNFEIGEIVQNPKDQTVDVGRDHDYIKYYTDCMLVFKKINIGLSPYIIAFGRNMTSSNTDNPHFRCTVRTDEMVRRDVAACCGVSEARGKQAISALVDAEVFIPIEVDGKRKRGINYVNPWVISMSEWKDIRQLKGQFDFINGAIKIFAIDEKGERLFLIEENKQNKKKEDES